MASSSGRATAITGHNKIKAGGGVGGGSVSRRGTGPGNAKVAGTGKRKPVKAEASLLANPGLQRRGRFE